MMNTIILKVMFILTIITLDNIVNSETVTWRKEKFPNPQIDVTLCGRSDNPSWVCDPDHLLTQQEGICYCLFDQI